MSSTETDKQPNKQADRQADRHTNARTRTPRAPRLRVLVLGGSGLLLFCLLCFVEGEGADPRCCWGSARCYLRSVRHHRLPGDGNI